jgi:hypothetical protein
LGSEAPENFNDGANIARYRHNLPFSPMRRRYKALEYLAVPKMTQRQISTLILAAPFDTSTDALGLSE